MVFIGVKELLILMNFWIYISTPTLFSPFYLFPSPPFYTHAWLLPFLWLDPAKDFGRLAEFSFLVLSFVFTSSFHTQIIINFYDCNLLQDSKPKDKIFLWSFQIEVFFTPLEVICLFELDLDPFLNFYVFPRYFSKQLICQ